MATQRRVLSVTDDVHARLLRLSRLHGQPASWFIGAVVRGFERVWQHRMTPDEYRRYCNDDVSHAEASRIRSREEGKIKAIVDVGADGDGDADSYVAA
jgi:hypothetical protein